MRQFVAGLLLVAAACSSQPAASRPHGAATPRVSPSAKRAAEWPQYMHDAGRSGLGPIAPTASNVQQAWTAGLDGTMYASPVVAGGVVVAATENNSVYAFDVNSGKPLWQRHLGSPMSRSAFQCGDVDPTGVTGTPVIDLAAGALYVSGFLDGSPPSHHLYALALSDGAVRWDRVVDPPGLSPLVEQQRGALALGSGYVYVPFGGLYGDCGAYKGAVVGVPVTGSGDEIVYVVPTRREAGIWAPPGPVLAADGTLFLATGNAQTSPFDHGDSVEHLKADLSEEDFWAPSDWSRLSAGDADIGSTSPALLDGGLVFQGGKVGTGYLLRAGHLGGIGGEAFSGKACSSGIYGGVAYAAPMLYVPCLGGGLVALRVDASAPSFSVAWTAAAGGETPIVAYARVWSVSRSSSRLVALDPATGNPTGAWPIGQLAAHFTTPAAADGRILVSGSSTLYCFTVA